MISTNIQLRRKTYTLRFTSKHIVCDEISSMIETGIIQHSDPPYSSPIVLVNKQDGSIRFCINFRSLNAIAIGDACSISDQDVIISKCVMPIFFTKLEMKKWLLAYWHR